MDSIEKLSEITLNRYNELTEEPSEEILDYFPEIFLSQFKIFDEYPIKGDEILYWAYKSDYTLDIYRWSKERLQKSLNIIGKSTPLEILLSLLGHNYVLYDYDIYKDRHLGDTYFSIHNGSPILTFEMLYGILFKEDCEFTVENFLDHLTMTPDRPLYIRLYGWDSTGNGVILLVESNEDFYLIDHSWY